MPITRIGQDRYCVTSPHEDILPNLAASCLERAGTPCAGGAGHVFDCAAGSGGLVLGIAAVAVGSAPAQRGYVVAGTRRSDGTWSTCIPDAVPLTPDAPGSGCEPIGFCRPEVTRYRCHEQSLPDYGIRVPGGMESMVAQNLARTPPAQRTPAVVRSAVQQAEREVAVQQVPTPLRPVAHVGAGVSSVVEAVVSPRVTGEIVDPWSGAGVTPGVVDPWAQPAATVTYAKGGMGKNGAPDASPKPVVFVSKFGGVYGSHGKVAPGQEPEGAEVQQASVLPVGPWFYTGVGAAVIGVVGLGIYYLVKE